MADKLLIRAYDVEVGDCIYVRIPHAKVVNGDPDDFHMLIDCGTKGSKALLKSAIEHLKGELPDVPGEPGTKRLDLLVVTHEHQDHIKGFDPDYFQKIRIENIWLSAAMNPDHPQAEGSHNLHAFATAGMRRLAAQGLALGAELQALVSLYSIDNEGAMQALRTGLPDANDIEPVYVQAGMSSDTLGLDLSNTIIQVLGPEEDIDHYYLGEDLPAGLTGLQRANALFSETVGDDTPDVPDNISAADFRQLRSRMLSNALSFAELDSAVKNNTSVVLLIEWRDRRLLFVGDAEWEGNFEAGKMNSSWNVMWHQRKAQLDNPIDFLKIGHHGSTNSTPWNDKEDGMITEPSQILDAILPIPADDAKPTAKAVVSTKRKNYKTIPKSALLVELGKRVANTRRYETELENTGFDPRQLPEYEEFEEPWLDSLQPLRTDHEEALTDADFVDVFIDPGD